MHGRPTAVQTASATSVCPVGETGRNVPLISSAAAGLKHSHGPAVLRTGRASSYNNHSTSRGTSGHPAGVTPREQTTGDVSMGNAYPWTQHPRHTTRPLRKNSESRPDICSVIAANMTPVPTAAVSRGLSKPSANIVIGYKSKRNHRFFSVSHLVTKACLV